MTFRKYMHLEKFGNEEVEGIELGRVYVFPKIDGTNASVWTEKGEFGYSVRAGSRTRELSEDSDNAGFCEWVHSDRDAAQELRLFCLSYPQLYVYGEWLVPHTFKGYRQDAWKRLYVFDVYNSETDQYLSYDDYKPLLDEFGIEYIPPLAVVNNGSYENFLNFLDKNKYLCPDDGEPGEGVVLKNYDYYNKFGRQVWAKIIRQEFKDAHNKAMGAPEINASKMNEERILDKALTQAFLDKEVAKLVNYEHGWDSKLIPKLFGVVYYTLIKEELWECLKEINFGAVNFKTLKALMIMRIKQMRKDLF